MVLGALILFVALRGLAAARERGQFYVAAAAMGAGVGIEYNVCMAVSVRSFTKHRGLAAGIVAAGYGAGTLPTVGLIERAIAHSGHGAALRALAWALSLACLCGAVFLPPPLSLPSAPEVAHADDKDAPTSPVPPAQLRLSQVLRRPSFYLLYVMLVLISSVGLVVTAQLVPLAHAYSVPEAALVLALQTDRVLNGVSRPLWGLVSDRLGRAHALGIAFGMQALVLLLWSAHLTETRAFVIFSALSTFAWGEIYSLFPALTADLYGTEYVGQNYGAVYTGKAVASFIAGPGASVVAANHSWAVILRLMAVASAVDAVLALALRRLLVCERDNAERPRPRVL